MNRRKKLGTSRRSKGRQNVKDGEVQPHVESNEDVQDEARADECPETHESTAKQLKVQEEVSQESERDTTAPQVGFLVSATTAEYSATEDKTGMSWSEEVEHISVPRDVCVKPFKDEAELEVIESNNTLQSEKVNKNLHDVTSLSATASDQQISKQAEAFDLCSVAETKGNKLDGSGLFRQDGRLQGSFLVCESHVNTAITPGIAADNALRENVKISDGVEQEAFALQMKALSSSKDGKFFIIPEVRDGQHSEVAEENLYDQHKPTQVQGEHQNDKDLLHDQEDHDSCPENQKSESGSVQSMFLGKSTATEEAFLDHSGGLVEDDIKQTGESAHIEGILSETGRSDPSDLRAPTEPQHPDSSLTTHESTEASFGFSATKRKIGSSRRNKGRRVKEFKEDIENTPTNVSLETPTVLSEIKETGQEEVNKEIADDIFLTLSHGSSVSLVPSHDISSEGPETDSQSLNLKSESLQKGRNETNPETLLGVVEISDVSQHEVHQSDTLHGEDTIDSLSEDVLRKLQEVEVPPTQMQESLQIQHSTESVPCDVTEYFKNVSGNLTDQAEMSQFAGESTDHFTTKRKGHQTEGNVSEYTENVQLKTVSYDLDEANLQNSAPGQVHVFKTGVEQDIKVITDQIFHLEKKGLFSEMDEKKTVLFDYQLQDTSGSEQSDQAFYRSGNRRKLGSNRKSKGRQQDQDSKEEVQEKSSSAETKQIDPQMIQEELSLDIEHDVLPVSRDSSMLSIAASGHSSEGLSPMSKIYPENDQQKLISGSVNSHEGPDISEAYIDMELSDKSVEETPGHQSDPISRKSGIHQTREVVGPYTDEDVRQSQEHEALQTHVQELQQVDGIVDVQVEEGGVFVGDTKTNPADPRVQDNSLSADQETDAGFSFGGSRRKLGSSRRNKGRRQRKESTEEVLEDTRGDETHSVIVQEEVREDDEPGVIISSPNNSRFPISTLEPPIPTKYQSDLQGLIMESEKLQENQNESKSDTENTLGVSQEAVDALSDDTIDAVAEDAPPEMVGVEVYPTKVEKSLQEPQQVDGTVDGQVEEGGVFVGDTKTNPADPQVQDNSLSADQETDAGFSFGGSRRKLGSSRRNKGRRQRKGSTEEVLEDTRGDEMFETRSVMTQEEVRKDDEPGVIISAPNNSHFPISTLEPPIPTKYQSDLQGLIVESEKPPENQNESKSDTENTLGVSQEAVEALSKDTIDAVAEDAPPEMVGVEVYPTKVEKGLQAEHLSDTVPCDVPGLFQNISENLIDKAEISEFSLKSDDDSATKLENFTETVDVGNKDSVLYDTNKPQISGFEKIDPLSMEVEESKGRVENNAQLTDPHTTDQTFDGKKGLFCELEEDKILPSNFQSEPVSFDSKPQEVPENADKKTDTSFFSCGNRRKMGSKRSNKGRQEDEKSKDVEEKSSRILTLESAHITLDTKTTIQEELQQDRDHNILPVPNGKSMFTPVDSSEIQSFIPNTYPDTDLVGLISKNFQDDQRESATDNNVDLFEKYRKDTLANKSETLESQEPSCPEHSDDAANQANEHEDPPTDIEGSLQMDHTSESVAHDVPKYPETVLGDMIDQAEIISSIQPELSVKSNDGSDTNQEVLPADDQQNQCFTTEGNLKTLDETNKDEYLYDSNEKSISNPVEVNTTLGQMDEGGRLVEASEYNSTDPKLQDRSLSTEEQTDVGFSGNRRKLGSSRRKKGRQGVKEATQEILENPKAEEAIDTSMLSLKTKSSEQEGLNKHIEDDVMLSVSHDVFISPVLSSEDQSHVVSKGPDMNLKSLVIKHETLQEDIDERNSNVSAQDGEQSVDLSVSKYEALYSQDARETVLEDAMMKDTEEEADSITTKHSLEMGYSSEIASDNTTKTFDTMSGNLTDQGERSPLTMKSADDFTVKQEEHRTQEILSETLDLENEEMVHYDTTPEADQMFHQEKEEVFCEIKGKKPALSNLQPKIVSSDPQPQETSESVDEQINQDFSNSASRRKLGSSRKSKAKRQFKESKDEVHEKTWVGENPETTQVSLNTMTFSQEEQRQDVEQDMTSLVSSDNSIFSVFAPGDSSGFQSSMQYNCPETDLKILIQKSRSEDQDESEAGNELSHKSEEHSLLDKSDVLESKDKALQDKESVCPEHSDNAANQANEHEDPPTDIEGSLQMDHTSESVAHDVPKYPETVLGDMIDQAEIISSIQPELSVKSNDGSDTKQEVLPADDQQNQCSATEGNMKTLDETNKDDYLYDSNETSISSPVEVNASLGQMDEGGRLLKASEYDFTDPKLQDRPLSTEEQTDVGFSFSGNRRKLGSSRRNKGRQGVKEATQETLENTRSDEMLHTPDRALEIRGVEQEDLSEEIEHKIILSLSQELSSLPSHIHSSEDPSFGLTKDPDTDLQLLILKNEQFGDKGERNSETEVKVIDKSINVLQQEMDQSDAIHSKDTTDAGSENIFRKVEEVEVHPTQVQDALQTECYSETVAGDISENEEVIPENPTDQAEMSELTVKATDDCSTKEEANPRRENYPDASTVKNEGSDIFNIDESQITEGDDFKGRVSDDIKPNSDKIFHLEIEGLCKMEENSPTLPNLQTDMGLFDSQPREISQSVDEQPNKGSGHRRKLGSSRRSKGKQDKESKQEVKENTKGVETLKTTQMHEELNQDHFSHDSLMFAPVDSSEVQSTMQNNCPETDLKILMQESRSDDQDESEAGNELSHKLEEDSFLDKSDVLESKDNTLQDKEAACPEHSDNAAKQDHEHKDPPTDIKGSLQMDHTSESVAHDVLKYPETVLGDMIDQPEIISSIQPELSVKSNDGSDTKQEVLPADDQQNQCFTTEGNMKTLDETNKDDYLYDSNETSISSPVEVNTTSQVDDDRGLIGDIKHSSDNSQSQEASGSVNELPNKEKLGSSHKSKERQQDKDFKEEVKEKFSSDETAQIPLDTQIMSQEELSLDMEHDNVLPVSHGSTLLSIIAPGESLEVQNSPSKMGAGNDQENLIPANVNILQGQDKSKTGISMELSNQPLEETSGHQSNPLNSESGSHQTREVVGPYTDDDVRQSQEHEALHTQVQEPQQVDGRVDVQVEEGGVFVGDTKTNPADPQVQDNSLSADQETDAGFSFGGSRRKLGSSRRNKGRRQRKESTEEVLEDTRGDETHSVIVQEEVREDDEPGAIISAPNNSSFPISTLEPPISTKYQSDLQGLIMESEKLLENQNESKSDTENTLGVSQEAVEALSDDTIDAVAEDAPPEMVGVEVYPTKVEKSLQEPQQVDGTVDVQVEEGGVFMGDTKTNPAYPRVQDNSLSADQETDAGFSFGGSRRKLGSSRRNKGRRQRKESTEEVLEDTRGDETHSVIVQEEVREHDEPGVIISSPNNSRFPISTLEPPISTKYQSDLQGLIMESEKLQENQNESKSDTENTLGVSQEAVEALSDDTIDAVAEDAPTEMVGVEVYPTKVEKSLQEPQQVDGTVDVQVEEGGVFVGDTKTNPADPRVQDNSLSADQETDAGFRFGGSRRKLGSSRRNKGRRQRKGSTEEVLEDDEMFESADTRNTVSENIVNAAHEDVNSTQIQDSLQAYSYKTVSGDATENFEIISGTPTDQAEACELKINSIEDITTKGEASSSKEIQSDGLRLKNEETVQHDVRPNINQVFHHDKEGPFCEMEGNTFVLPNFQSENIVSHSQPQELPESVVEQTKEEPHSRRKLGSSRRNKGNSKAKDPTVETYNELMKAVEENASINEPCEKRTEIRAQDQEQSMEIVPDEVVANDSPQTEDVNVGSSGCATMGIQPSTTLDQAVINTSSCAPITDRELNTPHSRDEEEYRELCIQHENSQESLLSSEPHACPPITDMHAEESSNSEHAEPESREGDGFKKGLEQETEPAQNPDMLLTTEKDGGDAAGNPKAYSKNLFNQTGKKSTEEDTEMLQPDKNVHKKDIFAPPERTTEKSSDVYQAQVEYSVEQCSVSSPHEMCSADGEENSHIIFQSDKDATLDSQHQDTCQSLKDDAHSGLKASGSRRKLGSSRRNKGRKHDQVTEQNQESKVEASENAGDDDATEMLAAKPAVQEELENLTLPENVATFRSDVSEKLLLENTVSSHDILEDSTIATSDLNLISKQENSVKSNAETKEKDANLIDETEDSIQLTGHDTDIKGLMQSDQATVWRGDSDMQSDLFHDGIISPGPESVHVTDQEEGLQRQNRETLSGEKDPPGAEVQLRQTNKDIETIGFVTTEDCSSEVESSMDVRNLKQEEEGEQCMFATAQQKENSNEFVSASQEPAMDAFHKGGISTTVNTPESQREKPQVTSKQKKRKIGSSRRTPMSRKREGEANVSDDTEESDFGAKADTMNVGEKDVVGEVPVNVEAIRDEDVQPQQATSTQKRTPETKTSDERTRSNMSMDFPPEQSATIDLIKETQRPEDFKSTETQITSEIAERNGNLLNQPMSSNTDTPGVSLEFSRDLPQKTQGDEHSPENIEVRQVQDVQEQMPSSITEGIPSQNPEIRNTSQNLTPTNRRRKMGSTRKNLATRTEQEILEAENESTDTVTSSGDGTAASVLEEKETELQLPAEHTDDSSRQGKEKETVEISPFGESLLRALAEEAAEEGPVSQKLMVEAEREQSPAGLSSSPTTSELASGGKRKKFGSNRKSGLQQRKAQQDTQPEDEAGGSTDGQAAQGEGSPGLHKISEVDENEVKAPSSASTLKAAEFSKPGRGGTPEKSLHDNIRLDQESGSQLSFGTTSGTGNSDCYNVVMIGESCVGKTSFMKRAQSGKFSLDLPASVGLDSCKWTVVVDGKPVLLQLWDTAGQERFHSITRQVFHKAQAFLLMYDITCSQSFSAVSYWANSIQEAAPEDVTVLLLGNKSDNAKRQVKTEQGDILAKEYNFEFMECSAATGENVIEALETVARMLSQRADLLREEVTVLHREPGQRNRSKCC